MAYKYDYQLALPVPQGVDYFLFGGDGGLSYRAIWILEN